MASNPSSFLRSIFPTAHRVILNEITRAALPKIKGNVLVIGVGFDPYGTFLTNATKICRTDIVQVGSSLDVVCDAHLLPFKSGSFDAVIAIEVFEHLENIDLAILEMLRVLKPHGKIIASVPFMYRIHGDPQDYRRLTKSGLLRYFAGCSSVTISEFGGRVAVISDLVTTISKIFGVLRLINLIFHINIFSEIRSFDCPSGYWMEVTK